MNIDPAASRLAAEGVAYAPQIAAAAGKHGLDPNLLAAVAAQETGGPDSNSGRNVVGDGGHGHGVFQIDDRWHAFAATPSAMDPGKNADYAAGMLAGLLKQYGGNVHEALSAYNSGSPASTGTTTRWGDGSVLGYADSVMRHYERLGGSAGPEGSSSAASAAVAESATTLASVGAAGGRTIAAVHDGTAADRAQTARDRAGPALPRPGDRLYVAGERRFRFNRLMTPKGDIDMSSLSSIHEGTLSTKPMEHSGSIRGSEDCDKSGRLRGSDGDRGMLRAGAGGSLRGDSQEAVQNDAMAEVSGLISSLGSLSAQAGSLPLTPPSLPGLPQNTGYQPQALDYGFSGDGN